MTVIRPGALVLTIIGLAGCAVQQSSLGDAKSQSLRDDSSCDIAYSVIETCSERGASYNDVSRCDALSVEIGKIFDDTIDAETGDMAAELCMTICRSSFDGDVSPSVAEICAES